MGMLTTAPATSCCRGRDADRRCKGHLHFLSTHLVPNCVGSYAAEAWYAPAQNCCCPLLDCRSDGTGGESIYGEKFAVSVLFMHDCSNL